MSEKENHENSADVRGYSCPYPAILTLEALEGVPPGETLEVLVDNPPSVETIPRKVKGKGHEIEKVEELENELWKIVIKKKS